MLERDRRNTVRDQKRANVHVTLPAWLLEEVDRVCAERGYLRAEFIREAVREKLKRTRGRKGG